MSSRVVGGMAEWQDPMTALPGPVAAEGECVVGSGREPWWLGPAWLRSQGPEDDPRDPGGVGWTLLLLGWGSRGRGAHGFGV